MSRMFCTPEDLIAQVDKEVLLQRADMDELPPWPPIVDEPEPEADPETDSETGTEPVDGEPEADENAADDVQDDEDGKTIPLDEDEAADGEIDPSEGTTDDEPDPIPEPEPEPKHDTITPAIVNASAEIAGYLRRRYALPETPEETPATLRKLCVDIAIYNIFSRDGIEQDKTHSHSIIVKRYDDAIVYLNLVADNKRDIDGLKGAGVEDEEGIEDGSGGAYIPLFRA